MTMEELQALPEGTGLVLVGGGRLVPVLLNGVGSGFAYVRCPFGCANREVTPESLLLPTDDSPEAALAALLSLPPEWRVACSKPEMLCQYLGVVVGEEQVEWDPPEPWDPNSRWRYYRDGQQLAKGEAPTLWQAVAEALAKVKEVSKDG